MLKTIKQNYEFFQFLLINILFVDSNFLLFLFFYFYQNYLAPYKSELNYILSCKITIILFIICLVIKLSILVFYYKFDYPKITSPFLIKFIE